MIVSNISKKQDNNLFLSLLEALVTSEDESCKLEALRIIVAEYNKNHANRFWLRLKYGVKRFS